MISVLKHQKCIAIKKLNPFKILTVFAKKSNNSKISFSTKWKLAVFLSYEKKQKNLFDKRNTGLANIIVASHESIWKVSIDII